MEALTRLVTDSLARYGFDRPMDPRRLQWSRWFRCDSPHSLLIVPSKPGIFAIAEEVGASVARAPSPATSSATSGQEVLSGAPLQRSDSMPLQNAALTAEATTSKRMLAVLQFSEDDDMAFTLDRMFTRINPMRARLSSGRCFLRFVVIEDQDQRRSICAALNQWIINSAEKVTGIGVDFQSSLEFASDRVGTHAFVRPATTTDHVGRTLLSNPAENAPKLAQAPQKPENIAAALDSGANKNLHCPHPLPSGF